MITATCATFAAVLASAQPGQIVHLPKQPAPCGYVRLHNVNKTAPGVTVIIHPDQGIGIHMSASSGLHFRGGWFFGGGFHPSNAGRIGFYATGVKSISIDGARFGNIADGTKQGMRIERSTDWRVSNSVFDGYAWDGMIVSDTSRFEILNNIFRDSAIKGSICTFPDGTVDNDWRRGRSACLSAGGTWTDGAHADAVQIFRDVFDGRIEGNQVFGHQQGIGVMGTAGTLGIARLWLVGNSYRGDFGHAFRWLDGTDMAAVRNTVGWPADRPGSFGWKVVLRINPAMGGVACENVAIPPGGAFDPVSAAMDKPCAGVRMPPSPDEPLGLPRLIGQVGRLPAPALPALD